MSSLQNGTGFSLGTSAAEADQPLSPSARKGTRQPSAGGSRIPKPLATNQPLYTSASVVSGHGHQQGAVSGVSPSGTQKPVVNPAEAEASTAQRSFAANSSGVPAMAGMLPHSFQGLNINGASISSTVPAAASSTGTTTATTSSGHQGPLFGGFSLGKPVSGSFCCCEIYFWSNPAMLDADPGQGRASCVHDVRAGVASGAVQEQQQQQQPHPPHSASKPRKHGRPASAQATSGRSRDPNVTPQAAAPGPFNLHASTPSLVPGLSPLGASTPFNFQGFGPSPLPGAGAGTQAPNSGGCAPMEITPPGSAASTQSVFFPMTPVTAVVS